MAPTSAFSIARLPRIVFGAGVLESLPDEMSACGPQALLVTGAASFRNSVHWPRLMDRLSAEGIDVEDVTVDGEPSPELIDEVVAALRGKHIDVVVGIGGGSALDAAKAIAGMLGHDTSVVDHLEGLGIERPYRGPAVPFIAVPTTAGTGSEATKNAVLSRLGPDGFKKSFRDEALVARIALVDPELLATCPPGIVAANGLDAFTQLLESYTSIKANPMTDALAFSGIKTFHESFIPAWQGGSGAKALKARAGMAYASLISGICLAQVGLGAVHGLASPLGAHFPIPHGVCCGTLVAAATAVNIRALTERGSDTRFLEKYASVSEMLTGRDGYPMEQSLTLLVETLWDLTERLSLPKLSAFGVGKQDVDQLVAESRGSSMRTNPIVLTDDEVAEIVMARL